MTTPIATGSGHDRPVTPETAIAAVVELIAAAIEPPVRALYELLVRVGIGHVVPA